jgi:hypothetical protein
MSYDLQRTNGSTQVILDEGFIDNSTSLTFVGKNFVGYGSYQNTNFLRLLENFANTNSPPGPIPGQVWFDSNSDTLRLKVYDGANWNQIPSVTYGTSASNQKPGDLWVDTTNSVLKVRTASGYLSVGPFTSAGSADSLTTARTINGVSFNGTSNITITASTTYSLAAGSYISGSSFDGSTARAWSVDTGNPQIATGQKVVARDSGGNIWYNIGNGTASSSRYADLAEKYLADQEYPIGTVIAIGGEREVTACSQGDLAIGVVSGNPGYMMNSELEGGTYIALRGRVPVKVVGPVHRKQRLIAADNGRAVAIARFGPSPEAFAIALEDSDGTKDTIEAIIL